MAFIKVVGDQLRSKHPMQPEPDIDIGDFKDVEADLLDVDTVWSTMKGMKVMAGGGPSKMLPRDIRQLGRSPMGFVLAEAFTDAMNVMLRGEMEMEVGRWAASGCLYAIWKDRAAGKIRPVVSGDMLTRLAGRCLMRKYKLKYRKVFGFEQQAIGEKGTEKIIHALRSVIDVNKSNPNFVLVSTDIENVYNSFSRKRMFSAVKKYFPGLYRFTVWKYAKHIPLFLSDETKLMSQAGSKQGDALSNLLYGVFDKAIVDPIRKKHNVDVVNLAFADDRYIAGETENVAAFFRELRVALGAEGAKFRDDKCHVHYHGTNPNSDRLSALFGVPKESVHAHFNLKVLGSYLGTDEYIQTNVDLAIDRVHSMMTKASDIGDPKCAMLLVKGSFGACRLTHLLRTTACSCP